MKITSNVLMLAQGGASAWASYIPITSPSPAIGAEGLSDSSGSSANNTTKQESDGSFGLLDKNMVKFIYENGLPSDVLAFISLIDSLSSGIQSSLFGPTSTTSQYKLILGLLPRLRTENERFKAALTSVEKNGGMNEIAVTSNGRVLTQDASGNISLRTLQDVGEDEVVLTNGQLANLRANGKAGAFNTELTNVILNGVGMTAIQSYLQDVISKIGKQKLDLQGYVGKEHGQVVKGLELLQLMNINPLDLSGMSVDGLYKVSNLSSSQKDLANQAIKWLWQTLPANMRTVLLSKARNFGDTSATGALKLLIGLVSSSLEDEFKLHTDLESGLDARGNKTSGSGGGSGDGVAIGPAEALFSEKGDRQLYTINYGNTENMKVLGNASLIADSSGNAIAKGTLQDAANGALSTVLDWSNATMGGQELNVNQMHKIALDGSRIVGAWLPIDKEEYYRTGVIRPDFNMLKRKELADIEAKRQGLTGEDEINALYQQYNVPSINNDDYRRFGIISGFADEKAFNSSPDLDDTLVEVEDDNLREGIANTLKAADKDYEMSGGFLGFGGTHIFRGSIYIPIINDAINASLGSKNYYKNPKITANEAQERSINAQKELSYRRAPSLSSLMQ